MKVFSATIDNDTKVFANYDDAIAINHTRRGTKKADALRAAIEVEHCGRLYGTNCMSPESELGDAIHDVTNDLRRLRIEV